jgi:hypothetical protein
MVSIHCFGSLGSLFGHILVHQRCISVTSALHQRCISVASALHQRCTGKHFFHTPNCFRMGPKGHPKSSYNPRRCSPGSLQRGSGDAVWKKLPPGTPLRPPQMPPIWPLPWFLHFPEGVPKLSLGSISASFWEHFGYLGHPNLAQGAKKTPSKKGSKENFQKVPQGAQEVSDKTKVRSP